MPNDCINYLEIHNLLPDQNKRISNTFTPISSNNSGYVECKSCFLEQFCPEPDFSVITALRQSPDTVKSFEQDPDKVYEFLINKLTTCENSSLDWRVQNWGTKWEFYEVLLHPNSSENAFECSFLTAWTPPLEGLKSISKLFPNALFCLRYEESGIDLCGVAVFLNGKTFNQYFSMKQIKESCLKELDQNLYARFLEEDSEDESLGEDLEEFWYKNKSDAIKSVLDPVSKCLRDLIQIPNTSTGQIEFNINSSNIKIDMQELQSLH